MPATAARAEAAARLIERHRKEYEALHNEVRARYGLEPLPLGQKHYERLVERWGKERVDAEIAKLLEVLDGDEGTTGA